MTDSRPGFRGRNPTTAELREAERILGLSRQQQRDHPTAVAADQAKLAHINTYGELPDFYLDRPFSCCRCGRWEIWLASDQKWYYEETKGHIDAKAIHCSRCRSQEQAD